MPDIKISEMSAAATLTGSEILAGVQSGGNVGITGNQLKTFVGAPSAANPTATIGLSATNGSAATFMRSDGAPALSQAIAPTWTGVHTYTPAARSSGAAPYYTINAPADTGITASTESIGISIVGATRTRAAGAVTTQREVVIAAPTYAAASATTITTAATVAIAAAPTAGSNVTITNPFALWVQAGTTRLDGGVSLSGNSITYSTPLTIIDAPGQGSGALIVRTNGNMQGSTLIQSTNGFGSTITLSVGGFYNWSPSNGYTALGDTGLTRAAAGVVQVNNGSTGAGGFSSPANTPAQITADQNNYSPGVGWFHRWSSDASRNVTGMVSSVAGATRHIWNVGSFNIVLQNENANSTAANRFTTSTGADLTLSPNKCALCMYDATTQRWRVTLLP